MQIQFHGAVRTTTGSCSLVSVGDVRFLVDCGMFQGSRAVEMRNERPFPFDPRGIDFVLVTHSHVDHIGLLPRLVKEGFAGEIIATRASASLLQLVLMDAAHIQEKDAEWRNRKAKRAGEPLDVPLYTTEDAKAALARVREVRYDDENELAPGIVAVFRDAGHILGSASIELFLTEGEKRRKVVFSGDVGNTEQAIIRDPTFIREADVLVVESTYGDRHHRPREDTLKELHDILATAYAEGGNVVIPAFAVGRTQEILYQLHRLWQEGRLPPFKVFIDSPMAITATGIYRDHSECFDPETMRMILNGDGPFVLPDIQYTRDTNESMAINFVTEPSIIISASGMCVAGRILHHLKHNLWKRNAHVVIVGYQAEGSLGRLLVEGVSRVRIMHEDIAVLARVHTLGGLSAHADQAILLEWVAKMALSKPLVYVNHGEEHAGNALALLLKKRLGLEARLPAWHETVQV